MRQTSLLVVAAALGLVTTLSLASLVAAQGSPVLTQAEVKQILKENQKLLAAAEKAQKRGDTATMEQNLAAFNERMNRLNEAIVAGGLDPAESETVLEHVNAATRKHLSVLERVHQRCLAREKLCQGIEQALQASRHGNEAATAALARTPAGARRLGRPSEPGRPGVGGPSRPGGPRPAPPSRPPRPPRPPRP